MIKIESKTKKYLHYQNQLPNRIYKFRIIGMALGGIPSLVFLIESNAQFHYWAWWLFSCYIWPHLAFIKAIKSKNPYISERNNLIFDTFIAGTWAAFLHFNLLPAVILMAITIADKINSGIKKLWLHSIPFLFLGILVAGTITGFIFQPNTSIAVMLACLPILTIHTLMVALGSNKLIRKVQFQNIKYKELSQNDSLTPLLNRKHWQQQSKEMINTCIENTSNATIILIDVNKFKNINDTFG